jgi:hypothetical protein
MNNKGVVHIVLIVLGIAVVLYLLLYLPFPSFQRIRAIVNYFVIFIVFLALQGGIIYGYYKLGFYVAKGVIFYNTKIANIMTNMKQNVENTGLK